MSRLAILFYGVLAYTAFLATFLYLIGLVTGFFAPITVDVGGPEASLTTAILIDVALIALFGIQHTIMARPAFKNAIAGVIPPSIERSTFVLVTCGVFALMFTMWRPLPTVLWSVDGALGWVVHGVGFTGWALVLLSTFLINHFDLFGLRQTWLAFRGVPYTDLRFQERSVYRIVRHPLMLGFLIAMWAAPTMTVGHLVFAGSFTTYGVLGLFIEERDLVAAHGAAYREYQRRVPKLIPLGARAPADGNPEAESLTA